MSDSLIPTLEQVQKAVDTKYNPRFTVDPLQGSKLSAEEKAKLNLGKIYHSGGREVLLFASSFLFFRPKWQAVIKGLVAALDEITKA